MARIIAVAGLATGVALSAAASTGTKVLVTGGHHELVAEMNDTAAVRDFLSMLPITFEIKDYSGSGRIGYPPRKLTTGDAATTQDPAQWDFSYYAPYGDIAIWYVDPTYSDPLYTLGKIIKGTGQVGQLKGPVTFKLASEAK